MAATAAGKNCEYLLNTGSFVPVTSSQFCCGPFGDSIEDIEGGKVFFHSGLTRKLPSDSHGSDLEDAIPSIRELTFMQLYFCLHLRVPLPIVKAYR